MGEDHRPRPGADLLREPVPGADGLLLEPAPVQLHQVERGEEVRVEPVGGIEDAPRRERLAVAEQPVLDVRRAGLRRADVHQDHRAARRPAHRHRGPVVRRVAPSADRWRARVSTSGRRGRWPAGVAGCDPGQIAVHRVAARGELAGRPLGALLRARPVPLAAAPAGEPALLRQWLGARRTSPARAHPADAEALSTALSRRTRSLAAGSSVAGSVQGTGRAPRGGVRPAAAAVATHRARPVGATTCTRCAPTLPRQNDADPGRSADGGSAPAAPTGPRTSPAHRGAVLDAGRSRPQPGARREVRRAAAPPGGQPPSARPARSQRRAYAGRGHRGAGEVEGGAGQHPAARAAAGAGGPTTVAGRRGSPTPSRTSSSTGTLAGSVGCGHPRDARRVREQEGQLGEAASRAGAAQGTVRERVKASRVRPPGDPAYAVASRRTSSSCAAPGSGPRGGPDPPAARAGPGPSRTTVVPPAARRCSAHDQRPRGRARAGGAGRRWPRSRRAARPILAPIWSCGSGRPAASMSSATSASRAASIMSPRRGRSGLPTRRPRGGRTGRSSSTSPTTWTPAPWHPLDPLLGDLLGPGVRDRRQRRAWSCPSGGRASRAPSAAGPGGGSPPGRPGYSAGG